jgi:hypothetical protein
MNCKDVLGRLRDYLDKELKEDDASEVEFHLRSCPSCRQVQEALIAEDKIYQGFTAELERRLEVSPEVWRRIQAHMAASRSEPPGRHLPARLSALVEVFLPRSPILRQALFAAALVVVSVGATLLTLHFRRSPEIGTAGVNNPVASERSRSETGQYSLEAALLSIQRAEREYNDAISVLSKIVDKRKPSLDPLVVAEVERNLRAIDESIAATRAAYHAHPSDPELAHYMLTAYEKKVELLQELAS